MQPHSPFPCTTPHPTTHPYPSPHKASPFSPALLFKVHVNTTYSVRQDHPRRLLPSLLLTKPCTLTFHTAWCLTAHRLTPSSAVPNMKLIITRSSSAFCYFTPLNPKYIPQYKILRNPQPPFFPQYHRPGFTPTHIATDKLSLSVL
jgi:hypothetical protein